VRARLHGVVLRGEGQAVSAAVASWAGLLVYVVGLGLAFGLRSWMQWRATGSSGFRGISGRPGSLSWWGGVLFVVALVLGLAAPVLALVGVPGLLPVLDQPAAGVIAPVGFVLAVGAVVMTLVAQSTMSSSWRIGVDAAERTDLVQTGLFARVRNPVFTAMIAVDVGVTLMVPTVVAVAALVCLVAAVQIQVRVIEEPYLQRVHGEAYSAYQARTGRFLPRWGADNRVR
jgi:protein-S-isoprenylcysteine O-methyltransferase Ste14